MMVDVEKLKYSLKVWELGLRKYKRELLAEEGKLVELETMLC